MRGAGWTRSEKQGQDCESLWATVRPSALLREVGAIRGFRAEERLELTSIFNRPLWLLCGKKTGNKGGIREMCLEPAALIAGTSEGFSQGSSSTSSMKW